MKKIKLLNLFTCVTVLSTVAPIVSLAEETTSSSNNNTTMTSTIESSILEEQPLSETSESSSSTIEKSTTSSTVEATKETATTSSSENESAQEENEEYTYDPARRSDLIPTIQNRFASYSDNLPVIVAGSAAAQKAPNIDFIDVSSHNGYLSEANFRTIKSYGVKGVVVKLTEGTTYINDKAASQISNAQKAGLIVSVYHYSWFSNQSEARAEADFFANTAINFGLPKTTVVVNDAENPAMGSNITSNSLAFQSQLATRGFKNHALYTYQNWVETGKINPSAFGTENVWMASYPYSPSRDYLQHTQYSSWQWSPKIQFPSVNSNFDGSVAYNGLFTTSGFTVNYDRDVTGKYGNVTVNNGIWDSYYPGSRNVGNLSSYRSELLSIVREASINGNVWYQLQVGETILGWVHSSGVTSTQVNSDQLQTTLFGAVAQDNGIWSNFAPGNSRIGYLGSYAGKELTITRSLKSNNSLWYQISFEGNAIGWVLAPGLSTYTVDYNTIETSLYGNVRQDNGIWSSYRPGSSRTGYLGNYKNKELKVERSLKSNNSIWYQISSEGTVLGWVLAPGLNVYSLEYNNVETNLYGVVKQDNGIWSGYAPGSSRVGYLGNYLNSELKVERSAKVDNKIWYQISANNKLLGWVLSPGIDAYTLEYNEAETILHGVVKQDNGIWSGYAPGSSRVGYLGNYLNSELKIERRAKTNNGLWYQISVDKKILGWVLAPGLDVFTLEYNKAETKLYGTVKQDNGIWSSYRPGNARVGYLGNYFKKELKITRSAKADGNIWYQISYENKNLGWVLAPGLTTYSK